MSWISPLERGFMGMADALVGHLYQPNPSKAALQQCKIIAHRGDPLGKQEEENTLAAFDRAQAAGVWGIEMDLHWTRDREPVVIHDPDLVRLYGIRRHIAEFGFAELRSQFPAIPALDEVIGRYGGRLHLMIEIKSMPKDDRPGHQQRLREILGPLTPVTDYHLLCLQPEALPVPPFLPRSALVAVADRLPQQMSRWVLKHRWGGICGHFLFIGNALIHRHHAAGQKVGIGYARSRNSLFRELNRGIDWIFSNDASALQNILNRTLGQQARSP
jgi:glycerophosphoryl diester phosphodiesterase